MIPEPKLDENVLDFCCGKKKCPVLRREGTEVIIADPDQASGEIRLTREQVEHIVPWLAKGLRSPE